MKVSQLLVEPSRAGRSKSPAGEKFSLWRTLGKRMHLWEHSQMSHMLTSIEQPGNLQIPMASLQRVRSIHTFIWLKRQRNIKGKTSNADISVHVLNSTHTPCLSDYHFAWIRSLQYDIKVINLWSWSYFWEDQNAFIVGHIHMAAFLGVWCL